MAVTSPNSVEIQIQRIELDGLPLVQVYEDSYEFVRPQEELLFLDEKYGNHEVVFDDRSEIPSPIYPQKHKFLSSVKPDWIMLNLKLEE